MRIFRFRTNEIAVKRYLISFLVIIFFASLNAQSRFDNVEIKAHKIKDHIFMLEGSGGNIGLYIGEEEVLIVDSQFAPLSKKITGAIRKITDLPIKWLVNTHWHGDHAGGNENFASQGAIIVGHRNVLERLSKPSQRMGRVNPASPEKARTDVAFEKDVTLNLTGKSIYVHHVDNAHTDGDSFVLFKDENVLHMGDCFFNSRFPFIDLSSDGSVKGYLSAIEGALMMVDDDTVIIPGHGDIADKSDLKAFHKMLSTLIGRMEPAMKNASSLEDISVEEITRDYESWGEAFISGERMVRILYDSLSK